MAAADASHLKLVYIVLCCLTSYARWGSTAIYGRGKRTRKLTISLAVVGLMLTLFGGAALAVELVGTDGPDRLLGTAEDDTLRGLGGNDTLLGREGSDRLSGGRGHDLIDAREPAPEADSIRCGRGLDRVVLGPGAEDSLAQDCERQSVGCQPTPPQQLGPNYEPDAPVRQSVGSGYVLSGAVLSAGSCQPVRGARIEFWLANPEGEYDDAHRATQFSGERGGEYRFESNFPGIYRGVAPHIHVRVTAEGFEGLVTQHYPQPGQTEATFDLVLVPEPSDATR